MALDVSVCPRPVCQHEIPSPTRDRFSSRSLCRWEDTKRAGRREIPQFSLAKVLRLGAPLRACLVRMRVGMVLYAISYEKDIPNRPLRCPVGPFATLPTHPKSRGKTTHPLLAQIGRAS